MNSLKKKFTVRKLRFHKIRLTTLCKDWRLLLLPNFEWFLLIFFQEFILHFFAEISIMSLVLDRFKDLREFSAIIFWLLMDVSEKLSFLISIISSVERCDLRSSTSRFSFARRFWNHVITLIIIIFKKTLVQ